MLKPISINGTKGIITDNSLVYLEFVRSSIHHADPNAIVIADKREDRIDTVITPSESSFKQDIIDNLLGAHHLLNLRIIFSKSLAKQKTIYYSLYFE